MRGKRVAGLFFDVMFVAWALVGAQAIGWRPVLGAICLGGAAAGLIAHGRWRAR